MIRKSLFDKSIFLSVCIIVIALVLTGCMSSVYSSGLINISYNEHKYTYLTDWEINSNNYTCKTINQDGVNLKTRLYDNDVNNEFLFCEDNEHIKFLEE